MTEALRRALEHEIALAGEVVYPADVEADEEAEQSDGRAVSDAQPVTGEVSEPRPVNDSAHARLHALIPASSPLHSMSTLAEVERYVAETHLIEIDQTRTNPVFGVGNPSADVMVIGEAPGANEDEQGEPFVGRAGQLLNDILKAIGFSRDEVYIANILKSRPPNNRNPLPDEIAAHEPILLKQIALIRPRVILSVGLISATTLLRSKSSLTALRQRVHDFNGIPLVVTYHPAALLRNPNWKRPTWEDVQLLRAHYDRLIAEDSP
jgi:uracil-DNA glycosylase